MKKIYFLIISFFSISVFARTSENSVRISLAWPVIASPSFKHQQKKSKDGNIAEKENSRKVRKNLSYETPVPLTIKTPVADDPRVKIYPNPTQESFKVEIELDKNSEVEIIVYNAIGKSIFSSKDAAPSGTFIKPIPFEEQPSGIYFVNVKSGEIKSVERLIKIK